MYNRWEWEQQRRNPLFSHKSTVKTERITPHFYPSFALLRATLSLASARRIPKPPPPPHGFRCRRSRPVKIQASLGNEPPVIPNLPTTLLSTPATSSRGRLCLSPAFFCEQMVTHSRPSWLLVFTVVGFSLPVWSAISTSTPTPPLQWLNITASLSGPSAPPLKGASIGYDETTRTLVVFGGESESGFPTSATYLCV